MNKVTVGHRCRFTVVKRVEAVLSELARAKSNFFCCFEMVVGQFVVSVLSSPVCGHPIDVSGDSRIGFQCDVYRDDLSAALQ